MQSGDFWRHLNIEFTALAEEEWTSVPNPADNRRLRAYGNPGCSEAYVGGWSVRGGCNESFRARFEETATRAGYALNPPQGTNGLDFWLHRLFLDLLELDELRNDIGPLVVGQKDQGAMIREVCDASATYCTRLGRRALDQEAARESQASHREDRHEAMLEAGKTQSFRKDDNAVPSQAGDPESTSFTKRGATNNYGDCSLDPKAEPDPVPDTAVNAGSVVRRRGFKANAVRHEAIADVVERHDGRWRNGSKVWRQDSILESICTELDQAEIDIIEQWRKGKTPSLNGITLKNWRDALEPATRSSSLITYAIAWTWRSRKRRTAPVENEGPP
jgi:hypothetical protein